MSRWLIGGRDGEIEETVARHRSSGVARRPVLDPNADPAAGGELTAVLEERLLLRSRAFGETEPKPSHANRWSTPGCSSP